MKVYPSFVGLLAGRVEYFSPNITVIGLVLDARVPPLSSKVTVISDAVRFNVTPESAATVKLRVSKEVLLALLPVTDQLPNEYPG